MADEVMGANWRVTDIRQTTDVTPSGRFLDVYEVTAETAGGVEFRVKIPVASYSPEVLKSAVESEAALLDQGRFLSG